MADRNIIADYTAARQRALALQQKGLISNDQYIDLAKKIDDMLHAQRDVPMPPRDPRGTPEQPTVRAPMPRPDPRGSTFATRLPKAYSNVDEGSDVPADVMLAAKGLDTTRKQGDAIDYQDNGAAPWYAPPAWGI